MSKISRCTGCGQFYDQNLYGECPNCNPKTVPLAINRTVAVVPEAVPAAFAAPAAPADIGRTVAVAPMPDEGRTVAIIRDSIGINPVVAWLVCTDGKEKGRDYRVLDGNNKIGRSNNMDICILGDNTISRENEAVITYASAVKKYYITAGLGDNVIYVNDEPLLVSQAKELAAYDRIKLGRTTLVFIPMCGEHFQW